MIFTLLTFALCATVCLQLFSAARIKSENSRQTSAAIVKAQSAAEIFKAEDGDRAAIAARLSASNEGQTLLVYYDQAWNSVGMPTERSLALTMEQTGSLVTARIVVTYNGAVVFELHVAKATGGVWQ
jgi:hypothetical protein